MPAPTQLSTQQSAPGPQPPSPYPHRGSLPSRYRTAPALRPERSGLAALVGHWEAMKEMSAVLRDAAEIDDGFPW